MHSGTGFWRGWAGGVLLAVAMAAGTVTAWGADKVHYEVTIPSSSTGDTEFSGDEDNNVFGDALGNAVNEIQNNVLVNAANPYDATVRLDILSDLEAQAGSDRYHSGWHLFGGTDPDDYDPTNSFKSVTINGGQHTLSGNGSNTLLRIVHVANTIDINSLTLKDGIFLDDGTAATAGGEFGGAGLMLGGNGIGEVEHFAPNTIKVSDVLLEQNKITVTSTATSNRQNAYGAGVYIVGIGADDTINPSTTKGSSDVIFTNVDLKGNILTYENTNNNASSIRGGGGRVSFARSFTYTGGTVSDNEVDGTATGTASGGGLSVDGGQAFTNISIKGVDFITNHVTATNESTGDGFGTARGGGFYSLTNGGAGSSKATIAFDSGIFKGNTAAAGGAGNMTAWGGGAFIFITNTDAQFTNTQFSDNTAQTLVAGQAGGGALAIDVYTAGGGTANGILTVSSSTFTNNNAVSAGSIASGGAIDMRAGSNHTITGSTFTGNRAQTATGQALGGAVHYVGDGVLNIANSTFSGNRVSANTAANAHGSAIYVATGTTGARLNLSADAGRTTEISGNLVGTAAAAAKDSGEGIYFAGGGTAILNISGAGHVILADGMTAAVGDTFDFAKDGKGRLDWDGVNNFNATGGSTVTLDEGYVFFGKDFIARSENTTDLLVHIGQDLTKTVSIGFDSGRGVNTPLFDLVTAGAGSEMKVGTGRDTVALTIGASSTQNIREEYVIASGLSNPDMTQALDNFKWTNGDNPYVSGVLKDGGGGLLKVEYVFNSPFNFSGPNALAARDPLDSVFKNEALGMSQPEKDAVIRNARAAYPELAVDQVRVMAGSVDLMARSAIDYGLRSPHRTRMRTELGYAPAAILPGQFIESAGTPGDAATTADPLLESSTALPSAVLNDWCASVTGLRLWTGYVGDWAKVDASGGLNGYSVDRNGFLIGLNYDLGAFASVGVYGGYSKSKSESELVDSSVNADAGHFGLLGRISPLANYREFSVYGDLGYHFASNDFTRNLGGWSAGGSFNQDLYTAGLGLEQVFCFGTINLTPHGEVRIVHVRQDDMTEHGTSATASSLGGISQNHVNTRLGAEVSRDYHTPHGVFSPAFNLAWRHEFGDLDYAGSAYYLNSAAPRAFNVASSRVDQDSVDIGLGMKSLHFIGPMNNKMSANIGYNLNWSRNSATHSLYAGVELGF